MRMLVFVYGTLMLGERNVAQMSITSRRLTEAEVAGYVLLVPMHGGFPIATPAEGSAIVGEVWVVDERTLDRLDAFEGVPSHYVRERATAKLPDGSTTEVWLYVQHEPPASARPIGSSWRAWHDATVGGAIKRAVERDDAVLAARCADKLRARGMRYAEVFEFARDHAPRLTLAAWDALMREADEESVT